MNISKLRIVIDDRERKSGIPKLLQGIGINAEIKTLPVGDYIVAPETIVERKSISDLISSVFDGRLFDQCTRLRKHYKNPIIIVEGNIDDIEKITENPLVFYGAGFFLSPTENGVIWYLQRKIPVSESDMCFGCTSRGPYTPAIILLSPNSMYAEPFAFRKTPADLLRHVHQSSPVLYAKVGAASVILDQRTFLQYTL